jgi:hypothetical protein
MKLELTTAQQSAMHTAILTRVRTIESLIEGWVKFPDEHSDFLIKTYTKDLETLKELETMLF